MELKISDLREKITIQRPQKYTDGEGNIIEETSPDLIKVWAKILPVAAKNSEGYAEKVQEIQYKIFIRYRTDIQISDTIGWKNKKLEQISPPYFFDGKKKFLVLQVRELVENE